MTTRETVRIVLFALAGVVFFSTTLIVLNQDRYGEYSDALADRLSTPDDRRLPEAMLRNTFESASHLEGKPDVQLIRIGRAGEVTVRASAVTDQTPSFELHAFRSDTGTALLTVRAGVDKSSTSADDVAADIRATVESALNAYERQTQDQSKREHSWDADREKAR